MRALKQVSNMQYNTINYSHHAVHYIPMTYLFYNWNVFPSDLLHPFHPLLQPNFKLTIVQINKYLKKKKKERKLTIVHADTYYVDCKMRAVEKLQ